MTDEEKLKEGLETYAKSSGFKLNPDEKMLDFVLKGLIKNKEKHGEIYCPCRFVTGNKEKDKEIICPCVFHKEEIKNTGHCKCGLFVKK